MKRAEETVKVHGPLCQCGHRADWHGLGGACEWRALRTYGDCDCTGFVAAVFAERKARGGRNGH